MTYQSMSDDYYRNPAFRSRAEMCARQEGYKFTADGRPDIAALGRGVTAGNLTDIDALIAAVSVQNVEGDLADDLVLLDAMDEVWPSVAAARYPQEPATG